MFISLDTKWKKAEAHGQPELELCSSGGQGYVCMRAENFAVNHKDGKAFVSLMRNMSKDELRELAAALSKVADDIEANEYAFVAAIDTHGKTIPGLTLITKKNG